MNRAARFRLVAAGVVEGDVTELDRAAVSRQRARSVDFADLRLTVPFDEWETVYRQRLQVERDLLAGEDDDLAVTAPRRPPHAEPEAPTTDRVVALGTAALIAVDAILQAARLTRSRSRR